MSGDHQVPPGIDPTVPSVAREAPLAARANKDFGRRVVRFLAAEGIRQFLDLGSGIPTTPPAAHDVARSVQPKARVVYVDIDPVVVAHSHALRSAEEGLVTILPDAEVARFFEGMETVPPDLVDITE